MLLYALGGRAVLDRVKRHTRGHVVERTLGRRPARHRRGHAHQPRRPLRGGAGQGHEPAGLPRGPHARAGELQRGAEPAGLAAAGLAVRRAPEAGLTDPHAPAGRRRHPGRQDPGAAQARPGPGLHQQPAVVQHPRQRAPHPGGAQRPRGAGGLLDLHLHQLHPHAAVPQGPVRPLPQRRAGDRRRRDAGVHLRAGGLQRPAGDQLRRLALPGGPGQPLRNLERVPEPVLAGRVPDRRPGPGPPHPVRRGRLQAGRGGGARAALRRGRPQPPAPDDGHRDHAVQEPGHGGDLSQPAARRGLRPAVEGRHPLLSRRDRAHPQRVRAARHLERHLAVGHAGHGGRVDHRAASRPPTSTW